LIFTNEWINILTDCQVEFEFHWGATSVEMRLFQVTSW